MSAFAIWLDRFLETYFEQNPVDATFIGKHDHDDRLPEFPPSGMGALRHELEALPEENLSETESIDRELATGFLEIRDWELSSGHLLRNPAWYTGEAIFGIFALLLRDFAPLPRRLECVRARLRAVTGFLDQGLDLVETPPAAWVERAVRECDGALAFLTEGLREVEGIDQARIEEPAERASGAFTRFRDRLNEIPSSEGSGACGEEAFRLLLRRAHFLEWDAEELLRRAHDELERSRGALVAVSTDWRGELEKLEDSHPSRERYYDAFRECWERSRAFAEDNRLVTWPDWPVDYVPRPPWSRAAAPHLYFLFYRSPPPHDRLPRVDYLVTPLEPDTGDDDALAILRATNDSVIKLNHVVHHGGIGHHVQNWHAARARSRVGQIAAVDGASRIAMPCGGTMAEGWACYATDLMGEAGFLQPLESYSQHHAHVRMAARAIVDVRFHCGDMSFAEAERFYVEHTAMSKEAAGAEVTKNSMFPGAAVIYFAGASLIHELRREIGSALGSRFDLRAFHDELLSFGSIPVSLIGKAMLARVKRRRS